MTYDLDGPRIRLGLAWAVVVSGSLALGRLAFGFPLLTLVLSATAAVAAMQVVEAWDPPSKPLVRGASAVIAMVVGCSAIFGARFLGAALLAGVALSLVVGVLLATRRAPVLVTVAFILQAALPVGLIAASVELTTGYEIGGVIVLLAMVMAFDVGDFIVGSGAASVYEGPIAGGLMIGLVGAVAAIIQAPPFGGAGVWVFALAASLLCPLGQVAASWLLPDAYAHAPAMRRLDALLLTAPVWAVAVGLLAG